MSPYCVGPVTIAQGPSGRKPGAKAETNSALAGDVVSLKSCIPKYARGPAMETHGLPYPRLTAPP